MNNQFENFEVTLKFDTKGVIYTKNPFDGVLAYLYAQKLKKEGTYLGEEQLLELPFLKKTHNVYHTSYPMINKEENIVIESTCIVKAFDTKLNCTMGKKPNANIDIQRGWAKSGIIQFESQLISSLTFYLCGEESVIKELLKDLTHYGKKSSLGYGKIIEITMKKIDTDLSLFNENNEPNRILPVKDFSNVISDKKAIKRPIFPYFERQGMEPCYI